MIIQCLRVLKMFPTFRTKSSKLNSQKQILVRREGFLINILNLLKVAVGGLQNLPRIHKLILKEKEEPLKVDL